MNRIYRECNMCYELHEVRYHLYKDNSEHLICICPDYGYTTLKYEKGLEIPYYKSSKRKFRAKLNGLLDISEKNTLN